MKANRDEPPENEKMFFVNITAAYQFLKAWRLERSLKKIKRYEEVIHECRKCVYNIDGACEFRETDKGVNADLSAGIPCRFGRSKEVHGAGLPCDYRGG